MHCIYESKDSGFVIGKYKSKEQGQVVCVGNALPQRKGITYYFLAKKTYNQYGTRYSVESFQQKIDDTESGIVGFLSCGIFSGIGEKLAQRIYDEFQKETLTILENSPERLTEVKGISKKKSEEIAAVYRRNKTVQDLVVYLASKGFPTKCATDLVREYGEHAASVIKKNPYLLCKIPRITFEMVDSMAKSEGREMDNPMRFRACLHAAFLAEEMEGNTGAELGTLQNRIFSMLCTPQCHDFPNSNAEWERMLRNKELILKKMEVIPGQPKVYAFQNYMVNKEEDVAQEIIRLSGKATNIENMKELIKKAEKITGIHLDAFQEAAVFHNLTNSLSIETGGPGTGKTTIIRFLHIIYGMLYPHNERIYLAPTGRAARRMSESIGEKAYTIHSYLNLGYEDRRADEDAEVEIENALVVIDESSMIGIHLAQKLFHAIKDGCCVVFSGDINQLPSVEAGRVFQDMIDSHLMPVMYLKKVHRQNEGDVIYENAKRINEGNEEVLNGNDFEFHETETPFAMKRTMADLYVERVREYGLGNVMCLCPYKEQIGGVEDMNEELQHRLNPRDTWKTECRVHGTTFRVGDPVMHIVRNTDEASNGDLGVIEDIEFNNGKKPIISVSINDTMVEYCGEKLDWLTLAYAMTVHKSQGSEADAVIFCISDMHKRMLYRSIPYVAVSRGKKRVDGVGKMAALKEAVRNKKSIFRVSLLGYFLKYHGGKEFMPLYQLRECEQLNAS